MGKRWLLFALLIAFLGINSSFTSSKQISIEEMEEQTLTMINKHRSENGKEKLEMNDIIRTSARKHSQNMASGRTAFGHDGFEQRSKDIGKKLVHHSMAENVAYNSSGPAEAVDQWIQSSGHHKNMLGNYKRTGIGIAKKGKIYYFTQIFTD